MSDYTLNCVNCGKQNLMLDDDPYDTKCEFGNHPVRIKNTSIKPSIKEGKTMHTNPDNAGTLITEDPITPPGVKSEAGLSPAPAAGEESLPPIPPRPDISRLKGWKRNDALKNYYEANAAAILQCRRVNGDTATKKLWGFSHNGWKSFLKRHDITERIKAPSAGVTTKAPLSPAKAAHLAKMRALRSKKCLTCAFGYDFEGKRYCSVKKCHSHLPVTLRAPYRPRIKETAWPPNPTANEMTQRYGHAAEVTGASIDGLSTAIKGMDKIIAGVESGNKNQIKFLQQVGPEGWKRNDAQFQIKFPAWNEGWPDAVKAVWLKSYVELYRVEWARETKHKENRLLKIFCWWRW